jgi:pilus assembly protein CpaE
MAATEPWNARMSAYSSEPLSVVAIGLDDETWRFLTIFATSSSSIRVRAQFKAQDQDSIIDQMRLSAPEICLIDFDGNRRTAVAMAESIHAEFPGTAVFAVSSQSQPNAILEAMRCGCSEYLTKPMDRNQLASAVSRISTRRREKPDQNRAQLLLFMGAKGGCGVTTLATQMGALLASSCSRSTLLLDLHPDFGDAALYLKLTNTRYHFFELLENVDRIDSDFLESFLVRHSSGLQVIPAPEGSVAAREQLAPGALARTLEFLRSRHEFVLADLPPSLNDDHLALIRDCDQLYLVTVAEVSAVRNIVRQLEYLASKDIPRDKIRVVLNRDHKRNIVTDAQIEKVIEQKIFWRVPNHYPQVVKTIHEGDPIAQLANSEVTRSLEEWAAQIGKRPSPEARKKETGGFLNLFSRVRTAEE